jgi:hypothetical protein
VVYPEETVTDSRGNSVKRPGAVGVPVHGCLMTPRSTRRDRDTEHVIADYELHCRYAPLGPWSRVMFDNRTYIVVQDPHHLQTSMGTAHVNAQLREER